VPAANGRHGQCCQPTGRNACRRIGCDQMGQVSGCSCTLAPGVPEAGCSGRTVPLHEIQLVGLMNAPISLPMPLSRHQRFSPQGSHSVWCRTPGSTSMAVGTFHENFAQLLMSCPESALLQAYICVIRVTTSHSRLSELTARIPELSTGYMCVHACMCFNTEAT
jgi:hypothetical protein